MLINNALLVSILKYPIFTHFCKRNKSIFLSESNPYYNKRIEEIFLFDKLKNKYLFVLETNYVSHVHLVQHRKYLHLFSYQKFYYVICKLWETRNKLYVIFNLPPWSNYWLNMKYNELSKEDKTLHFKPKNA